MGAPTRPRMATTARVGGRLTRAGQAAAKAVLAGFAPQKQDFTGPLEVELGCGNGLSLLARARANPHTCFIANDVFLPGLMQLAAALKKNPQPNVRIAVEDARDLLARLPKGGVQRILIPFPDPWPKARHHKRRIVQPELLAACHRALVEEGELWVVTDWPSYAYHAISRLHEARGLVLAGTEVAAANCKPSARAQNLGLGPRLLAEAPPWWEPTKYQHKAMQAGRGVWYILAVKNS